MFDPFKDFDAKGYLRNVVGEKDLNIVKQLEHDLFTVNPSLIKLLIFPGDRRIV